MQLLLRAALALGALGFCASASVSAKSIDPATLARGLEAVERVRHAHRLWPADNPAPKPELDAHASPSAFRARAIDLGRRTEALRRHWNVELTPEALQAELNRMARETRDPARLEKLFDALGRDPRLAAEVLARPTLVDRLIRARYAFDPRIHAAVRRRAEAALLVGAPPVTRARPGKQITVLRGARSGGSSAIAFDDDQFDALAQRVPGVDEGASLDETEQAFNIVRTLEETDEGLVLEIQSFPKRPFEDWWATEAPLLPTSIEIEGAEGFPFSLPAVDALAHFGCNVWEDPLRIDRLPAARSGHSAVWTGAEMLVWGGFNGAGHPADVVRYDPATDTWSSSTASANVPQGRVNHTAVWTGTEMVIWGGSNPANTYLANGGRYDPATDSWRAVSAAAPAPWPRIGHSAIWTGTRMVIWGGSNWNGDVSDGGQYDPVNDVWTSTALVGTPQPRRAHSAVWTGTEMIVWGGAFGGQYLSSLGRYVPATDVWLPNAAIGAPPSPRVTPGAVWTGSEMLIWGGADGTGHPASGGRFNPLTASWSSITTNNMPAPRSSHVTLWLDSLERLLVWGGANSAALATGALYDPAANQWEPINTDGAPAARQSFAATWTGSQVLLWGGVDGANVRNSGSRYDPQLDTWTPMAPGLPLNTTVHSAIWTGNEMIVWGGSTPAATQAGAAYEPATATWSPLPIDASTPAPRHEHAALWTGSEMLIWGGRDQASSYPAVGGAYDPSTGSWRPLDAGEGMPVPRALASAVWTGTEAIFWGGLDLTMNNQDTGGRYDPASDTWTPVATANAPSPRNDHTAVWTGDSMIVWGGCCGQAGSTGAIYDVASDTWSAISIEGAPGPRYRHQAVWGGDRMIVVGGWSGFNATMSGLSGGLYDPAANTWTAIAQPPAGTDIRDVARATAVWTGHEMLLWGGEYMYCAGWSCPWHMHYVGGRFDPWTNEWTVIPTTAFTPVARRHHTAVWTGNSMLLWGGTSSSVAYLATGGIWSAAAPLSPGDSLRVGKSTTTDLSWEECEGATAYVVKRCVADGAACMPGTAVAYPGTAQYSDALTGPSMYYLVEGMNGCGYSP